VRGRWVPNRYEKPVLFERHAVGGEYQAGYNTVGAGTVETIFTGVLLRPFLQRTALSSVFV
jgi:hypothetical protein